MSSQIFYRFEESVTVDPNTTKTVHQLNVRKVLEKKEEQQKQKEQQQQQQVFYQINHLGYILKQ